MLAEQLKSYSPQEIEELKKKIVLKPLNSVEELCAWMFLFFDIDFPSGVVYPTSTHGPADAMWRIYELMKTGKSQDIPQVTMLSSRDSFKTLSAAALEVLCFCHFRISIAHAAAVLDQAEKAVQYSNSFFRNLRPYLEYHGWSRATDNKKKIEWITDTGESIYLRLLVMSVRGMNCIAPDSMIKTINGHKAAESIHSGEKILTYNYSTGFEEIVEVGDIGYTFKEALKVTLDDNSSLILSNDHQIFTEKGWVTADSLRVGSLVCKREDQVFNSEPTVTINNGVKFDLYQMLYGTLLGDASINVLPSGSCRYQVSHCEKQLPYLKQIGSILSENNIRYSMTSEMSNGFLQYRITTQVHEIFKQINELIKFNGKKTVTKKWTSLLTSEALAYLIMDDGTVNGEKLGTNKEYAHTIATYSFSENENGLLVEWIKSLGYEADLHVRNFGRIRFGVKLSKKSSRKITKEIGSFFNTVMKYKLLVPEEHLHFRRFIDTGAATSIDYATGGFLWSGEFSSRQKTTKRRSILQNLNRKVVSVEAVGLQSLIDISIKTNDEHLKSFIANGVLVHNSEHLPMLFIDEVDIVQDVRALKEAKMVPSIYKQYFPLTVYLSTRKFAGGLMEKTLKETLATGGEVLRWNILDVTERIGHEVAKIDEPKVVRYLSRTLPNENLTPDQWNALADEKKHNYERFEAYAGIALHPLLPVMRNYLVDRNQSDVGGLYKPLIAVNNNFKQVPPDMGEAQLLCNKPSSSGLVYPRFDNQKNVLSIQDAIQRLTGEETSIDNFEYLKDYMKSLGVTIVGGGDWGYTDYTVLLVIALMAGGEAWVLDTFIQQHLELDDIVKYGKEMQDTWDVDRWYVDQNYPAYLKTLKRKAGMKCPKFTKVVEDGITGLQGKIVDSANVRRLYVLDTLNNKRVLDSFGEYKWQLDGKGEIIEGKPYHDKEGVSDIMDALRYPAQNLFIKGKKPSFTASGDPKDMKKVQTVEKNKEIVAQVNNNIMKSKVQELVMNAGGNQQSVRRKGKIFW